MSIQCTHSGKTSCTQPSSEQVNRFLSQAETLCQKRKQRLTDLRKHVLELVCGYGQPVGAYQLLDDLKSEGRSAAPPTVYRALDFLQQLGLVHRLATSNTYLACAHPQSDHSGLFLVCSQCGVAQEIHASGIVKAMQKDAKSYDFDMQHASVEIAGLCKKCKNIK